ncbi:rhodanese domain containing protein [Diplocarpon rosae]|nr:rhodanese domain containing protein [Diplocarpon rosae]
MSSIRVATSISLRTTRPTIPRASRIFRISPNPSVRPAASIAHRPHWRFYSQSAPSKAYAFEDVKALVEKPDPNRILIDTREPAEVHASGTIPGSLNIPVSSKPDSFFMSAEEFEDRFGFERPRKDQELVFFCKAGVRSKAAAAFAWQAGWINVAEYPGSWLDWDKNGGAKEGGR